MLCLYGEKNSLQQVGVLFKIKDSIYRYLVEY